MKSKTLFLLLLFFLCLPVLFVFGEEDRSSSESSASEKPARPSAHSKKKSSRLSESDSGLSDPSRKLLHHHFQVPNLLKDSVEFWKAIYAVYDRNQVVLHDTENLSVVYSVLNLSDLDVEKETDPLRKEEIKESRLERVRLEKKRILEILSKLKDSSLDLKNLSPEELQIYSVFQKRKLTDQILAYAQPERVRGQTGQKDKLEKAIVISGAYLPEMEDIFHSKGLPVELTRIAFVESMFNTKARSKVGASGIWQFMPATGRLYVKIDGYLDSRNDPILATHAAAALLKGNYEKLGSWPLAINAYNSGVQTLARAVREMGTDDIGVIASRYRGGIYGFASRSFYPCFLAILEVTQNYKKYFGPLERLSPMLYDELKLPKPISFSEIARQLRIPQNDLVGLNPGYDDALFESSRPVPAGYPVRVPRGMRSKLEEVPQVTP